MPANNACERVRRRAIFSELCPARTARTGQSRQTRSQPPARNVGGALPKTFQALDFPAARSHRTTVRNPDAVMTEPDPVAAWRCKLVVDTDDPFYGAARARPRNRAADAGSWPGRKRRCGRAGLDPDLALVPALLRAGPRHRTSCLSLDKDRELDGHRHAAVRPRVPRHRPAP